MSGQLECIEEIEWFHPNADRHISECLLMQNGEDGSYLLRPSSKQHSYTLSVRGKDSVKHYKITWNGKQYCFGMACFVNMAQFVSHFQKQPLVAGESGVITLLRYPYPRQVVEPEQYDSVIVHAHLPAGESKEPAKTLHVAIGSKEGFLVKKGAVVKSWKMRWFVLMKYDLKYYRRRGDTEPIKTIDLREGRECVQDNTQGHDNCFRLVLPSRTFYFYTTTEGESREWIDILQWKIKIFQETGTM